MIKFDSEARQALAKGVDTLANAVKTTLGPEGRNVIIEKPFGDPHVTKDGVTVAREVQSDDPAEAMGIQVVRQAASATAEVAGDGTTTCLVLAQSLIKQGFEAIENGESAPKLTRELKQLGESVCGWVKDTSEGIEIDSPRLEQVATISANGDSEMGKQIAKAIRAVGPTGKVLVEESRHASTQVNLMQGTSFDKGFMSEYFVTNPKRMLVELSHPLILFVDMNIKAVQLLVPIITACNTGGVKVPLVIICDDIIEQALNMVVANKMKSGLEVVAVRAPSFGDNRKDLMKDMATATGGMYISESEGITLDALGKMPQKEILARLGDCEKVTVSKNTTVITGGAGSKEEIEIRINTILADIENTNQPHYLTQMKDRIAKLSGGIAVIEVGGTTEVEMKEKKDLVEDAVLATQAALEEGIVEGGGMTLLRISRKMGEDEERTLVDEIMRQALRAPLECIVGNAGLTMLELFNLPTYKYDYGFNARTLQWEDLLEEGIVDPCKVTLTALRSAVSVACTILSTNATINMNPKDKPQEVQTGY